MAQDLFGFLWYNLGWINLSHVNLSFLNFHKLPTHITNGMLWQGEWNQSELSLLATALVVVVLTSLSLANDIHWARSEFGWLTGLAAVQLFSNSEVCIELTKQLHSTTGWKTHVTCLQLGFSRPEDGFQICFIALVTGLVTVAGSVGYHWFSVVYQFLGFLCLEDFMSRPLFQLQLHNVSIPDCFLLNHVKPFLTNLNQL